MEVLKTDLLEEIDLPQQQKLRVIDDYEGLITKCRNCLSDDDKNLLKKALILASKVHKGEYIFKDQPYLFHPINVSKIVSEELGMGINSMVAAFLHEVFDKGSIEVKQIKSEFGDKVFSILKGLSKVSGLDVRNTENNVENLRKLILTLANDVRVVLIKIADRLHNMRTIEHKSPEKQIKIALETSYLYAPLAHRLGLYNIKSELEDLALKYLDSETYAYIEKKLQDTEASREKYISNFIKPIKEKLESEEIAHEIKCRTKSIASIWNKMKKQDVDFNSIYDIYAIRIIIDSPVDKEKELCWKVFSFVSDLYQPNPKRMRDWISIPKSNGYESLHTTVLGPDGKWVEVQIRSTRMDDIAERGFAAHWIYKGGKNASQALEEWLSKMRELLETPESSPYEFIDNIKLSLYSDEVFVFTPIGDIKKLPVNSTVLDFAFEIHSEVGGKCVGAKINNRNVGIRELLQNGDQVEIITSKNQKPTIDWLNFVVTSKAKSRIKSALKEEKLLDAEYGKEIIKRRLKNWKINFSDEIVTKLLKHFKIKHSIDFYYLISQEKIDLNDVKGALIAKPAEPPPFDGETDPEEIKATKQEKTNLLSSDYIVIEDKVKGVDYKLSPCCNPVFGDKVFGFVTILEGIKIHRFNCPNAPELLNRYPYRIVGAKWTHSEMHKAFQTILKLSGIDGPGILGEIYDVIAKDTRTTLRSMNISNNHGLFIGTIKIFVHDLHHLESLISKFNNIKGINKVTRLNN